MSTVTPVIPSATSTKRLAMREYLSLCLANNWGFALTLLLSLRFIYAIRDPQSL